jgi:serine/threonine protein kinase
VAGGHLTQHEFDCGLWRVEGDLFTHIRRAQKAERFFPERQVLDWVAQIALALDHIHGRAVRTFAHSAQLDPT